MAMKGCSVLLNVSALLEPYHRIVKCHTRTLVGGESYPSAEMQSVYSTAPADWDGENIKEKRFVFFFNIGIII